MRRIPRRDILIASAALVLILAVTQWVVRPVFRHRDQLERRIATGEKRLQELIRLEQTYSKVLADGRVLEQSVRSRKPGFTLFAFLEALASQDGLKGQIEFMRPSVKALDDGHQEEQVEMRLNGVTMERLLPYFYHIETAPEQVRIKRLTIRPQQRNQSLLEVNLVVITRSLAESSAPIPKRTAANLSWPQ